MDNTNYNIAIIGQTGVGKSSLINYLYGERTVETGTGRPVTTNGFHKVEHSIKGMKVNIYDSWGLEVGKQEQWLKELDQELKNRDIDKPASEWFHSIFYCISAPSARIQDADIEIIKKLRSEKNKISIVLTKADAIAEEDEECFIKEIKKALGFDLAIIPVCSESKKTRGGVTHKFGKELVEKQSLIDLVDSLILRIPAHCQDIMISQLISWQENTHNFVDKKIDFFGFKTLDLHKELSSKSEDIVVKVRNAGNHAEKLSLEQYGFIVNKLSGRIKLYSNTEYLKMADEEESKFEFEWLMIPFMPFMLAALPFAMPFLRKDESDKMHQKIDSFCASFKREINNRTQDLEKSLQGIREELMSNLAL